MLQTARIRSIVQIVCAAALAGLCVLIAVSHHTAMLLLVPLGVNDWVLCAWVSEGRISFEYGQWKSKALELATYPTSFDEFTPGMAVMLAWADHSEDAFEMSALILAIPWVAIFIWVAVIRRRVRLHNLCPNCQYPLLGQSRCAECGSTLPSKMTNGTRAARDATSQIVLCTAGVALIGPHRMIVGAVQPPRQGPQWQNSLFHGLCQTAFGADLGTSSQIRSFHAAHAQSGGVWSHWPDDGSSRLVDWADVGSSGLEWGKGDLG